MSIRHAPAEEAFGSRHPRLFDALQEPARAKAIAAYSQLLEAGEEPADAEAKAFEQAQEWALSRVPQRADE